MTWKEKILEKWPEKFDEATFKEVYLTERDGCVPDMWADGDINKSITEMFYYVLSVIRDEVYPDGVIVIEASYEGSTSYVIMDIDTKRVLYNNTEKAWWFYFETEEDFDEWCNHIAQEVRRNVVQVYLFDFGDARDAVCARTPKGVYEIYNSACWDDIGSGQVAEILSNALNVKQVNLDASKIYEQMYDESEIPWAEIEKEAIKDYTEAGQKPS